LKIQIKDNPNNFDVVYQNFMEHYGWFQNSYLGVNQTITKEWLKKFADDIANNNPTKEEKRNKESINEEYKLLVKIASEAISFQDDKKKLLTIAVIIMSNRLISISQKTNISFEDLYWLTVDELLTYDIEVSTEITRLAERVKQYKETGERFGIMTEKGYYDINKAFWSQVVALNSPKEEVNILTGSIGNRGKIQGTVKIVLNVEKDSKKLDEGEILVTSMTRPEFLPLMQKAAAFITDEGGITCHAAIIAREMKKPCIIGTKIATQVLKDGDLVEVDADTGVVRILEK
jgi:phosphohistidine swiveling domain-containing protein